MWYFLPNKTPGFSGADIANVCKTRQALIAARKQKTKVEKQDFLDAVGPYCRRTGKKETKLLPLTKKAIIAYHEAGHATVSWLLGNMLIRS